MKQERAGGNAGMQPGRKETQQKRSAEGQVDVSRVVKAGNDSRMECAVGQCGNRQKESHKRTGGAYVKQGPSGANRRTNQNKCAERAHQRREGNEKRIAGADVMITAGEEKAELMSQQKGEQGEGERQAGREGRGMVVDEGESGLELLERNNRVLFVS